jgi:hypothetical protein
MKSRYTFRIALIALLFLTQPGAFLSAQDWKYLGQTPPGSTPVRFVNTPFLATSDWFWHGAPAFSPEGTDMFFVKYQRAINKTEIWYSSYLNGAWTAPQVAPFSGSGYSDNNPKFFGSRDTLYFQSERPASAVYKVIRHQNGWSAPTKLNLQIPAGKGFGKQFSLAGNGNLYGELDNLQGTNSDLYCWRLVNKQYQAAVKLTPLCSSDHDGFPTIDVNDQFMIFGSNRSGGFGYFDLYLSYKNQDGSWNQPVNLGDRFNSGTEETWSYFSSDGAWFFYTTDRTGDLGFNPYWVSAQVIYDMIPKTPYLGQVPPGLTPEKFAPGIVSSDELREYSLTLSSDSSEIYFYRFGENVPSKVYSSRFEKGSWSVPEVFGPASDHPAAEPCMTPDNRRLYFMWNTGSDIHPYYMVERGRTGWSAPVLAGDGMYMTASSDGQMYTTDISTLFTTGRTYLAKIQTSHGLFTRLTRLDIQPHYGTQAHPCIAPDSSYILFDVDGGTHLFVSFRKSDGTWDTGIDLANHGFDPMAGGAYISPDGKYLFFHLNGDIWWVDSQVITTLDPFTGGTASVINTGTQLFQNAPNPCDRQTRIAFQLENPEKVSLDLYNLAGIKINSLIYNQFHSSGNHEFSLNTSKLPSGIYQYTLTTESGSRLTQSMIVGR